MTATSLLTATTIILEVLPVMCHRLITNPYPEQEWDSIIVSSDPITVREKKQNETTPLKLTQILRPQKRSYEECPENDFNCLYGNNEGIQDNNNNKVVDRFLEQYSQVADVKYNDGENATEEGENDNSRKSYWTMIDSQTHHHPYDDKKGWVTLDPVPWSTSKISKWHPNKAGSHQENKPWGYGPTTQRPVQQFWVSGSSFHTQRPTSQWGLGTNDIITDNKPSDFPTGQYNTYGNSNQGINYRPYGYPPNYPEYQQNEEFQGNYPPKSPQNGHPSTYPSNGDGEWVLLSTTKGYSIPQRHRWASQKDDRFYSSRKIKPVDISRYHEENLNEKLIKSGTVSIENRKSDSSTQAVENNPPKNVTRQKASEKIPIQVLYTGSGNNDETVKTFKRKVRLQVLPALENTSTSYGGLLEVDSKLQTVDEAQQEDEKMQQLKAIANVKKNKIRGFKLVPTSKIIGKGMSHNSMMTIAAVGAGMIPATMALLVPMALGRRRRSSTDSFIGFDRIQDEQKIRELRKH